MTVSCFICLFLLYCFLYRVFLILFGEGLSGMGGRGEGGCLCDLGHGAVCVCVGECGSYMFVCVQLWVNEDRG